MLDILKDACIRVRESVKDMIGMKEAGEALGRGAGGDISRKIDIVAENVAINTFKEAGLRCTVIAEEAGEVRLGDDDGYIILDAIDGTTNAIRGFPFTCCSIAYSSGYRFDIKYSAIIDLINGDMYYSSKNNGAYLNGKRINVKASSYIIGINLSGASNRVIDMVKPILNKSNHLRHLGANALELCFFANGLMDAYIDLRGKLRVTDLAAAYLIVNEAGGIIINEDGSMLDASLSINERLSFIAAANRSILEEIADDLNIRLKI
ncbi:MAG: inositol monophosphatase family protein [Candidatus Nitrosocaldaceae archaeon]